MSIVIRGRGRGRVHGSWGAASGSGVTPPPPPPPPAPPSITSFTITDNPATEGVATTFNWTLSGDPATSQILNPGDGSGNYTVSPGTTSQDHTYDFADAVGYDATLTVSNSGGSDSETIPDIVVEAAGGVDFQAFTTLKSDTSGEHWVTPFGIPGSSLGTVSDARKSKIVAKYGGNYYPVQTDNHLTDPDDATLMHAAGHVKLPSSYVAQDLVEIGYSDTYSFPSAPTWSTVTSGFTANFTATISVYNPKVHLFNTAAPPKVGDVFELAITDGTGTLTYTIDLDTRDHCHSAAGNLWPMYTMMRRITQDASGRYRCYDRTSGREITYDWERNDPREPYTNFNQFGRGSYYVKTTQNVYQNTSIGVYPGSSASQPFVPEGWYNNSGMSFGQSFIIYPRWHAGNPEDYSISCTITRSGRELAYDAETAPFVGGWKLAFKNQTTNFSVGQTLTGGTSGAVGEIFRVVDSGATGTVVLRFVKGTFQNNETITTATGSAQADGTQSRVQITGGTSGATADLLDVLDSGSTGTLHVRNITGTFQDNEIVTDGLGGSATVNGTMGAASTFGFTTSSADTTGSASGTLPSILSASNRVTYTADFNDGSDVTIGAWFNGHQVYQQERICQFKNGGTPHGKLEARMVVSWDRDGNIIDRQIKFENPRMFAWSMDYVYDVTAITVNGSNVISGSLDTYKQLIHTPWAKWRWKQSKAFGMCDPVDFMRARLIPTWRRFDRDMTPGFAAFAKGHDTAGDDVALSALSGSPRGGYSRTDYNDPLYPGPWKFDAGGGASPTIGVYTYWEWAFWSTNPFANGMWEAMNAVCDNNWGAWPFYPRDENGSSTDGWNDTTPHPYLRYQYSAGASRGAASGQKYKVATNDWDERGQGDAAAPRTWSFWAFGTAYAGTGQGRKVASSHAGQYPGRSAYLAVPDSHYHEMNEQYAWFMGSSRPGTEYGGNYNNPKSGGVAGDADHRVGFTVFNGNRSWAWAWRSWLMGASLMFDRHPRRAIYRRVVSDMNDFFLEHVQKTWLGFINVRLAGNSNNYGNLSSQLGGQNYGLNETMAAPGNRAPLLDLFKGSYLTNVAIATKDLRVANTTPGLDYCVGYLKMVNDLPSDKWYTFQNIYYLPINDTNSTSTDILNNCTPLVTENFDTIRIAWEAKSDAVKIGFGAQRINGAYVATPKPDFVDPTRGQFYVVYVQNYPVYRFYTSVYQGLARHMSDSAKRAEAEAIVDLLDGYIPPDTIDTQYYNKGYRYDYTWGMWSMLKPGQYDTEWT